MTLLGIYLCMSASVALGYVARVQIERLQNSRLAARIYQQVLNAEHERNREAIARIDADFAQRLTDELAAVQLLESLGYGHEVEEQ